MVATKLSRQGNSTGVVIPARMLKQLHLKQGDEVEVTATEKGIVITPSRSAYQQAMEAGREGAARYRRALAELAR